MRSAFAYVPRPGPLQSASPAAAVAYLGSLLVVAFLCSSPLVLAAAAGALAMAGVLAGAGRAVRLALRIGLGLALLVAAVNSLVVDRGATVLARLGDWPLLGRVDVTLEALIAGLSIGLLAFATILAGAVYSACVDPDRVLRALRPIAGRSALTATLASRLFPVAVADGERLRDASRLRGPGAAPVSRAALARRLLAGSLDRAVDVAATLELRGYGLGAPRARQIRRPSRYDRRFYAVAATVLAAAVGAKLVGAGGFDAYPTVSIDLGAATLTLSTLVLLAGLAPLRRAPSRRRAGPGPPLAELRGPAAAPPLEASGV
ncbi:MAG TPA: energy-coupling factor transporter transmembrane component T [Solirubrobacterales bacterium]|nr:energy-coupling factor transporter transmembrane component T [Solirubrobacterales bacterium]